MTAGTNTRSGTGSSTVTLKDFKQMALLGEGAYSTVFKVMRLSDQKIYSLKKVKLPSLSDKEKTNSLNEVRLLASVQHENVIAYKEAFLDEASGCLCIVTEYADGGDLYQKITQHQKLRTFFRESDVWHCLFGMGHGLKALHDMKILHRDMKCANVFLGSKGEVKLGDFNVSKVAKRGLCMTQTGTPYYASPEVWRDMPYDAKSDMWSLGCILYEMVALRPPFRADDMEALYRKVLKGQYPRIPSVYSRDVSEAVSLLLQVNPRQRPNIEQFLTSQVMQRHANFDGHGDKTSRTNQPSDLLQTIKLPKNCMDAENLKNCMPKPRYDVDQPSGAANGDAAGGTEVTAAASLRQPIPEERERRLPDDGRLKDALDSLLYDGDSKAPKGSPLARDYDKLPYQQARGSDHDPNNQYGKHRDQGKGSHGQPMAVQGAPANRDSRHLPSLPNRGQPASSRHNHYAEQSPTAGYQASHDHRYAPGGAVRQSHDNASVRQSQDIERCYGQRASRNDRPDLDYRQRYDQPQYSPQNAPQYSPQHAPQYSPHHAPQYSPQRAPQYSPQHAPQYSPQHGGGGHGNYNNDYYQRQAAPSSIDRVLSNAGGSRRQLAVAGGAVQRNKRPDQNRPYYNRQPPTNQNRRTPHLHPANNHRLGGLASDRPIRVY